MTITRSVPRYDLVTLIVLAMALPLFLTPSSADGEAKVDLVTFGPGDALWSRFGHVGILVDNPGWGEELLFSYGYAPFGEPSFIWGYLRGQSRFQLVIEVWDDVVERYREMDRTIERQPLLLPRALRDELISKLVVNARPENREYVYDHLMDNCATRVRDLLDEVTKGALARAVSHHVPTETYRERTLYAASGQLYTLILLDLASGPNQETTVDGWAELFLPGPLRDAVAAAELEADGQSTPLAGPIEVIYARQGAPPQSGSPYLGRYVVVVWCLFIAVGLAVGGRLGGPRARRSAALVVWLSRWQLTLTALLWWLVGAALCVFVLISEVRELQWNENALLFWPSDVLLLVVSRRWKRDGAPWLGRWMRAYVVAHLVVIGILITWKLGGIMGQDNWAFVVASVLVFAGLLTVGSRPSRPEEQRGQTEQDGQDSQDTWDSPDDPAGSEAN